MEKESGSASLGNGSPAANENPVAVEGSVLVVGEKDEEGAISEEKAVEDISGEKMEDISGEEVEDISGENTVDISIVRYPPLSQFKHTAFRYANSGGNFYTGMDVTSEEAALRRTARTKRFGVQPFGTELAAAKGEPMKLVESLPIVRDAALRLEAIHIHGTDEMNSKDVFSYFKLYSPRNIEWVNDSSCNVVWEDEMSAHRALYGLGTQPVALRCEYDEGSSGDIRDDVAIGDGVHMLTSIDQNQAVSSGNQTEGKNHSGVCGSTSQLIQWRLGESHPKAKQLLLRCATVKDMKRKGSAKRSNYYLKYGRSLVGWKQWKDKEGEEERNRRSRIGKKSSIEKAEDAVTMDTVEREEGEIDEEEEENVAYDPFEFLVKRPKSLYSDRLDDSAMMDESEKQRQTKMGVVGLDMDLRSALRKKKRNLKLRIGQCPRLVEKIL